ncbi:D,D-heptose 1,7-bisphosphate phosphatase [Chitinophaga costaii]|uniref:D,D-heptose 1,7-bisphosphate phosphatase n=1 Tax=Chitinophaga costaii TaxID=1335309 RepID=A0A1C4G3D0_9BACT|nr:HAD family hydrolase [Chitinophaga costaii]PUZ19784.1 HAD family hydrolase [Chitinophaga costaii]SCC62375.1 D,D-heptose 1,7-bisphosphate phosphatase [Chitinophaga costaii]
MRKAIFLDKDGTLVYNMPHNADPGRIFLQESMVRGLRQLQAAGYLLVVVTNQAGVARGYFPEQHLQQVRLRLENLLAEYGILLDGFYYCPHHPGGCIPQYAYQCDCRKPMPGMFFKAARDLNIDLSDSWMLGDILDDVEAGNRAGCSTVLIDNGNETAWHTGYGRVPDHVAGSINEAAAIILQQSYQYVFPEHNRNRPFLFSS